MNRISQETRLSEAPGLMCDGNPGAATVLGRLFQKRGADAIFLLCHLDDMEIYGSDIWLAYKDVCNQDIDTLIKKITTDRDGLKDAIARARGPL